MSKTGKFMTSNEWQAVQLNGLDIKDGVYSVVSISGVDVGFVVSTTLPINTNGDLFFKDVGDNLKFDLDIGELLYAKTIKNGVQITVVQA
jgi:hypothetical protein